MHAESKGEFIIHFVEESYDVMFSRKEVSHGQFDSFKANDGISKPHKSNLKKLAKFGKKIRKCQLSSLDTNRLPKLLKRTYKYGLRSFFISDVAL